MLESPSDCKETKPVYPKGNEPWIFIGRTDAETEVPILWPPNVKSWLTRKDPDASKDWGKAEKGATEAEMCGWHHWLNGMSLSKLWEIVKDREAWRAAVHGIRKSQTWLTDWTELNWSFVPPKRYVEIPTPSASECDLIQKQGLSGHNKLRWGNME